MPQPNKLKVRTGKRFNKLKVIKEVEKKVLPSGQKFRQFNCLCDCGNETVVVLHALTRGRIKSCGCLARKMEGESASKLGRVYRAMIQRCTLPGAIDKHRYEDRGITVCKEWLDSYAVFKAWAIKNGWQENLQIDRRENDKGYTPENCRFVTPIVNTNNRSNTKMIIYNSKTYPIMDLLREKGLQDNRTPIEGRIKRGWTIEEAIDTPIKKGNYGKAKR